MRAFIHHIYISVLPMAVPPQNNHEDYCHNMFSKLGEKVMGILPPSCVGTTPKPSEEEPPPLIKENFFLEISLCLHESSSKYKTRIG